MRTQRKLLALLMVLCLLVGLMPGAAMAEDADADDGTALTDESDVTQGDGTEAHPYTLEEFNALNEPVSGTVYVTLGTVNMTTGSNSITIGNDNLVDKYVSQLPTSAGTINDDQSFTISEENKETYIIAPVDQYLLQDTSADSGKNYSYVKNNTYSGRVGYYTKEKPYKEHLNLIIVGGTINGNTQKVTNINSYSEISVINVKVQDNADITFKNVTVNGCYQFYMGYTQRVSSDICVHTLQSLTFENCTFNGVWFQNGGDNAKKTVFEDCTFTDYNNDNNSNPIWIQNMNRMQSVTITGCTVTSTRPIKFESNVVNVDVTITNNTFTMLSGDTYNNTDPENVNKNAALMFGTNAQKPKYQFDDIVISNNKLMTDPGIHQQLIALFNGTIAVAEGSKMTLSSNVDSKGDAISGTELIDEWKAANNYTDTVNSFVTDSVTGYVATTATITDSDGFVYQYATLQDAVDAAKNDDVINVVSADAGNAAVNSAKDFTVAYDDSITGNKPAISAGNGYDISIDEDGKITVTKRPDPTPTYPTYDDDDDDEPTYTVTAPKSSHGTVKVTPSSASEGNRVTITVKPDAGYEVDEVTVTDKNGKSIKVTDRGDNKYTFTMPASKVEVEVTFVKEYVAPAISFDDVSKGAWYYDAAQYVADKDIMSGTGGNNFSPDMTTSRAMIWTILARLDGQNVSVVYGNWYDKAQMWAMTNRVSDGTNPNGSITREQLAVMLYSFAQANGYTGKAGVSLSRYLDASETSTWAVEAMEWAVGNSLISSTGGNLLSPTATATRAQVAVILMNFCENLVK